MPDLKSGTHRQVTAASRFGLSPSPSSTTTPTDTLLSTTDTLLYGSSPTSDLSSSDESSSDDDENDDDDNYSLSTLTTTSTLIPSSISPPPSYHTVYPPSPPSSVSSNGSIGGGKSYINPLHKALQSPKKALKPSLTARSSSSSSSSSSSIEVDSTQPLFEKIFPASSAIHDLLSTPISLSTLSTSSSFLLATILEHPSAGTRTLYISSSSSTASSNLSKRETVCELLELAEEAGCTGMVVCLERKEEGLGELLHSLMYVGGTITRLPFEAREEFILVGLDV